MLYSKDMEKTIARRTAIINRRADRYEMLEDSENIAHHEAVNPERDYARIMTRQEN